MLGALSPVEQGVVLGALLCGPAGIDALQRLAGETGERCREAQRGLARLEGGARRRLVVELTRRLCSPLPSGLERVHPSWIAHLVEGERGPAAEVLRAALPGARVPAESTLSDPAESTRPDPAESTRPDPAGAPDAATDARPAHLPDAIRACVIRQALGSLEPMGPPADPGAPLAELEALPGWTEERIVDALEHLGLLILAPLLRRAQAAGSALEARVLADLSPGLAGKLRALLAQATDLPAGLAELLDGRGGPAVEGGPRERLLELGAAVLGPLLPPRARRQTAQRLPRPLGLLLLAEDERAARIPGSAAGPWILDLVRRADRWARTGELA